MLTLILSFFNQDVEVMQGERDIIVEATFVLVGQVTVVTEGLVGALGTSFVTIAVRNT